MKSILREFETESLWNAYYPKLYLLGFVLTWGISEVKQILDMNFSCKKDCEVDWRQNQ